MGGADASRPADPNEATQERAIAVTDTTKADELLALREGMTLGSWIFEPHNLAGADVGEIMDDEPSGELFPMGYISTSVPQPIFALQPVFGQDEEQLANARAIAAVPDMLDAIEALAAERDALRAALTWIALVAHNSATIEGLSKADLRQSAESLPNGARTALQDLTP